MNSQGIDSDGAGRSRSRDAEGKIKIAQARLLKRFPFHARFLARWDRTASSGVDTMGVTFSSGGPLLLYNPSYVCTCSLQEVVGLLIHEVNHVIFEHPFADPRDYPDQEARLVAEELCVNEWNDEPLPGSPILLEDFPDLPPEEDTKKRYRRLETRPDDEDFGTDGGSFGTDRRFLGTEDAENGAESELRPLDDHSLWEVNQPGVVERIAVQNQVIQVMKDLTEEDWESIPDAIQVKIGQLSCGNVPGNRKEALMPREEQKSTVNWRKVLRRYVKEALEWRPTFDRPPRRFPDLVGVVPGAAYRAAKPKVLAIIDTSGSVGVDDLDAISLELDRMARDAEVVVVEADTEVQAVYPYREKIESVSGRGGTDFRPALSREFLTKQRARLAVYFSDGYGPAPTTKPIVPVIWCLTDDGCKPSEWGREVRMA